jgi:uncharacterized protein with NAD-binding domain and iron-sulfur cluster
MAERPQYIHAGGNVMMHAPLELDDSQMYGFFVRGTRAALQRTVDQTLNAPAAGKMHFKVLSPYVMLTFTRVHHAWSSDPADHAKGWGQETDIVTWVLVGQQNPGSAKIDHLFVYPCHIWVDDCMALINGREIYGYPKFLCEYTMPQPGEPPRSFTLAAKGFEPFGPDEPMAMHPLLEIESSNPQPTPLKNLEQLVTQAVQVLASDLDALDLDLAGWEQVAKAMLAPQLDQIFLKQFPDASGTRAVYQAVVAAPAVVKKIHAVELLGGDWRCNLHRFASFPLDQTLGLPLGEQPAILPFHVHFDFEVPAGRELVVNNEVAPQKVAILGGGVAAMTAAWYLSDQPGWQDRYDITVYQMGWRLGGKGASGRNALLGQRIEEHGLHIWFGFYDNAFEVMQKAYAELKRPPDAPLASWDEAFKPQHFIALSEFIGGQWKTWPVDTPLRDGVPGHGNEDVTLWDMVVTLYDWIKMWLDGVHAELARLESTVPVAAPAGPVDWLHRLAEAVEREVDELKADVREAAAALAGVIAAARHDSDKHAVMKHSLVALREWLHDEAAPKLDLSDELRRGFIMLDMAWTMLIGMVEDEVFDKGFDVINDIDLRAWFAKHGAKRVTTDGAPLRGFYDLVFAYEDGDIARPNLEAGTMLRGILRIGFAYHGGVMWKMQAGMGDVVFAPIYQALKARGVKFEFFQRVEELAPSADGPLQVETIRLTQQVALKGDGYDPLVDVDGLPCWPSAPEFAQLDPAQAALLQQHGVNLESSWSDWPEIYRQRFGRPLPERVLKRGTDFDLVVFGISAAAVRELCPQLVARSQPLATMCDQVKTVATQAYQVWLNRDLRQIGWTDFASDGQEPVLSGFAEPFDTWAPMDQLLCREAWPPQIAPKNVSYFCSPLQIADYPPYSDHGFPGRCTGEVKQRALMQLTQQMQALWPAVAGPGGFDWNCLVDPQQGQGEARFDRQYWRANVDPSERYVLSVVGSTAHRLATDGAGVANLYLTGDWIRTGINAGCVEAAVMAGMQASRAISGWPQVIKGEGEI